MNECTNGCSALSRHNCVGLSEDCCRTINVCAHELGMNKPILSVIMPVYNELPTLPEILKRVLLVPVAKEVLVVDDGSTDGTWDFLKHISDERIKVFRHATNRGKGSAIRTALPYVEGQLVIIQDGDLEYDPMDYLALMRAVDDSQGVVYGSRNLCKANRRGPVRYWLGGILLSRLANILYGLRLTDEPTCYKLFRADIIKSMHLECVGFEFCPEITAKVGKQGIDIKEVPIKYTPRTFLEGKKIRWTDGLKAAWTLLKYRFVE
jgi:dolichol-phosphate mannosyltransferase